MPLLKKGRRIFKLLNKEGVGFIIALIFSKK
jgi:hypothetical protein